MQGTNIEELTFAIETAREVGISKQMLRMSEKKLAALKEQQTKRSIQRAAHVSLTSAMTAVDTEALAAAIDRATQAELGADIIAKAQARMESLRFAEGQRQ